MDKNEIDIINKNLKILKGKKLKLSYDGVVILEKVNPTAEELFSALFNYVKEKKCSE